MSDVKVFTGTDVLAALKAAVNTAGVDTMRECRYLEYIVTDEQRRDPIEYPNNPPLQNPFGATTDPYGKGEPVQPHCIAGTVLYALGVPIEVLKVYESQNVSSIKHRRTFASLPGTGPSLGIDIDDEGWAYLADAQSSQDARNSWGHAVADAETNHIERAADDDYGI